VARTLPHILLEVKNWPSFMVKPDRKTEQPLCPKSRQDPLLEEHSKLLRKTTAPLPTWKKYHLWFASIADILLQKYLNANFETTDFNSCRWVSWGLHCTFWFTFFGHTSSYSWHSGEYRHGAI